MNYDIASYYHQRAGEYDKVYLIPEEQDDLLKATEIFQSLFSRKQVLEIACGTGYWTERISESASSVFATDVNESVIEIARSREQLRNVVFEVADMYALTPETQYDALFGGFIWSHILLQDLDDFLRRITAFLKPDATVAFIDSKLVESGSHSRKRITKTDREGNTYQTRKLENGTTHLVLKNFPSREFLIQKLAGFTKQVNYLELEHYWIVHYKLDH